MQFVKNSPHNVVSSLLERADGIGVEAHSNRLSHTRICSVLPGHIGSIWYDGAKSDEKEFAKFSLKKTIVSGIVKLSSDRIDIDLSGFTMK